MTGAKLHREPRPGVCQFARSAQGLTNHQTQFVVESRLSAFAPDCTIETIAKNNRQKLTKQPLKMTILGLRRLRKAGPAIGRTEARDFLT